MVKVHCCCRCCYCCWCCCCCLVCKSAGVLLLLWLPIYCSKEKELEWQSYRATIFFSYFISSLGFVVLIFPLLTLFLFESKLLNSVGSDYIKLLKFGDSLDRCVALKETALEKMAAIVLKANASLAYLEVSFMQTHTHTHSLSLSLSLFFSFFFFFRLFISNFWIFRFFSPLLFFSWWFCLIASAATPHTNACFGPANPLTDHHWLPKCRQIQLCHEGNCWHFLPPLFSFSVLFFFFFLFVFSRPSKKSEIIYKTFLQKVDTRRRWGSTVCIHHKIAVRGTCRLQISALAGLPCLGKKKSGKKWRGRRTNNDQKLFWNKWWVGEK